MNKMVQEALNIKAGKNIVVSKKKLFEKKDKLLSILSSRLLLTNNSIAECIEVINFFTNRHYELENNDKFIIKYFGCLYFTQKLYNSFHKDFDTTEESSYDVECGLNMIIPFIANNIIEIVYYKNIDFNNPNEIQDKIKTLIKYINNKYILGSDFDFIFKKKSKEIANFILGSSLILQNLKFQNQLKILDKYYNYFIYNLVSSIEKESKHEKLDGVIENKGKDIFSKVEINVLDYAGGYLFNVTNILLDATKEDIRLFNFPKTQPRNSLYPMYDSIYLEISYKNKIIGFGSAQIIDETKIPTRIFIPLDVINFYFPLKKEMTHDEEYDGCVMTLKLITQIDCVNRTYETSDDETLVVDITPLVNELATISKVQNSILLKPKENNENLALINELVELTKSSNYDNFIKKIIKISNLSHFLTKINAKKKEEIAYNVKVLINTIKDLDTFQYYLNIGNVEEKLLKDFIIAINKIYAFINPESKIEKIKLEEKINEIHDFILKIRNLITED